MLSNKEITTMSKGTKITSREILYKAKQKAGQKSSQRQVHGCNVAKFRNMRNLQVTNFRNPANLQVAKFAGCEVSGSQCATC